MKFNKLDKSDESIVDYFMRFSNDCDASGCDSICRCSLFDSITVDRIKFGDLALRLCNPFDPIDAYIIERLLVFKNKEYDLYPEDWVNVQVTVSNGYYGEEVDCVGVNLEGQELSIEEIFNTTFQHLSPFEKIQTILMMEYGEVSETLKGCSEVSIKRVQLSDLQATNKQHLKNSKVNSLLYTRDIPIGIYKKLGKKYNVVDGYHRLSSVMDNASYFASSANKIDIIVME